MNNESKKTVNLPKIIKVKEFADLIDQPAAQVIKVLMENGFLANINETLDFETASLIADEFGYAALPEKIDEKRVDVITTEQLSEILSQEKQTGRNLKTRPPIVTILGHVDHGKTTLLDTIRKAKVAESESGGITQHITAYQVPVKQERRITFVDTPGHEAFKNMRARGSGVADIAILIVAADDGVKPQTLEVIKNLQKGKVPMVVAINKIDKPEANPEKVKGQLAEAGVMLEQRGGETPWIEISAKNNQGIDELLETVILLADVLELKADYDRKALGIVLESHLDQRKGAIATVIIKTGVLQQGDSILAAEATGTARQILDYQGKRIIKAEPADPVVILGLDNVSKAGSVVQIEESRSSAKEKAKRIKLDQDLLVNEDKPSVKKISDSEEEEEKSITKFNLILKADVEGSLEAVTQIIKTIKGDDFEVNILTQKVGNITESDVQLAATSKAIIYGFKVKTPEMIKQTAEKNKVQIKNFDVIYKLIEDIKYEISEALEPEIIRDDLGELEVLAVFRTEKQKMIIGGKVTQGKVLNKAKMEIYHEQEQIGKGEVEELKHNQDQVEEVKEGMECGITYKPIGPMVKIQTRDVLKFYQEESKKRVIE
ncbi:MAG: translation initiation factor IF-2 [Candidatus Moranbacteria bacterium]|nr:translation initiation factor IF-2 [Candidatus Moranbacteria bacterium]